MQLSRRAAGFAMLDALIAVVILAIGVLAFASVQANVMVSQRAAKMRQYGLVLAEDLLDRMRANRAGLADYTYAGGVPAGAACGDDVTTPCLPDEMAERDIEEWVSHLETLGFDVAATRVDTVVSPDMAEVEIEVGWPSSEGAGTSYVTVATTIGR